MKQHLSKEFDVKDLRLEKKILGLQITRDKKRETLKLYQEEYFRLVLQRFNMRSVVSNEAKENLHD